ncbi:MAG TPA: hypothetical protein VES38_06895 [Methylotenera sp.]|nr:hypothetical protein [Methylotenera sp.]
MLAINKPTTLYLPQSESKRASMYFDLPYGSHYSQAPFQLKRAPALAAFAAYSSISAGVAIGMTTLSGALMIAGGVASLIGAFTGNEFLTKFGMVAGIAGGVTGAFSAAGGGAFNYNPLTEGFGGSQLGAAAGKAKDFFGDIFGNSEAVDAMGVTGDATIANISESAVPSVTADSFASDAASSFGSGTKMGVDLSAKVGAGATKAASSGGGLFSQLLGNKDAMNLVGGAAEGYNAFQDREAQQPLIDSNVDLRNAQTGQVNFETNLAQDRYNNMQAQPGSNISVNQDAQVFAGNQNQTSPRIAVAINGEVKYMTTEEYAAYKQQNSSGGGLLQQGAA